VAGSGPVVAPPHQQPGRADNFLEIGYAPSNTVSWSALPGSEINNDELAKPTQTTAPGYTNARRFPRWHLDARIQVSVFRKGDTALFWGRTSELGEDGIGATLSGELTTGEVVTLEFPIPIAPFVMKVRAIVRYSHGLSCGFEFLVVTGEQKETLRRTCEVLAHS